MLVASVPAKSVNRRVDDLAQRCRSDVAML
jgi:hypothetical protein